MTRKSVDSAFLKFSPHCCSFFFFMFFFLGTNFFIQKFMFTLRQQGDIIEVEYEPKYAECSEIKQVKKHILGYKLKKFIQLRPPHIPSPSSPEPRVKTLLPCVPD